MNLPRNRYIALAACALVLASGCARVRDAVILDKPAPRVALKGYPLDLAFGEEPVEPQEIGPQKSLTTIARETFVDFFIDESPPQKRHGAVTPVIEPCPPPGPTAYARVPIASDITKPPVPGVYLFHQAGTIELVGLGKQAVSGLTSRILRNVVESSNGSFTFDVDQTIGARRAVITYTVTPGASMAIKKIVRYNGSQQATSNFAVGATVFTLPVTENTSVTGAAVDPVGGQSLVAQAFTDKKQRIEGCEEVADGWHTSGTWTLQGAQGNVTYNIEYTVATQHGGLLISDTIRFTETQGPLTVNYDITTAFGHIDPKPEAPK